MSISGKIVGVLSCIAVVVGLFCGVVLFQVSSIDKEMQGYFDRVYGEENAADLQISVKQTALVTMEMIADAESAEALAEHLQEIAEAKKEMFAQLEILKKVADTDAEKVNIEKSEKMAQDIVSLVENDLAEAIRNRAEFSVLDDLDTRIDSLAVALNSEVEALSGSMNAEMQDAQGSLKSKYTATVSVIITSGVVLLILLVVSVVIVQTQIVRPLKRFVAAFGRVASGEKDLTIRMPVASKDEIGQMSGYFNTFISSISEVVTQVKVAGNTVAAASSELSASSGQLLGTMNEQSSSVSSVAGAMEQLSATSLNIMDNVSRVTANTAEASGKTEQGVRQVQRTVESMEQIRTSTRCLADTISSLGESSGHIGNILDVINDIADQTNLLALNAAIEAARAGDAGRGFAVVADEVRKLAERTQGSTKQIQELTARLLKDAKDATAGMETAGAQVEAGMRAISVTEELFASLADAVSVVTRENRAVEQAVREQVDTVEAVNRNLQCLASGIEECSSALHEVTGTVQSLEQEAVSVDTMMGSFRV